MLNLHLPLQFNHWKIWLGKGLKGPTPAFLLPGHVGSDQGLPQESPRKNCWRRELSFLCVRGRGKGACRSLLEKARPVPAQLLPRGGQLPRVLPGARGTLFSKDCTAQDSSPGWGGDDMKSRFKICHVRLAELYTVLVQWQHTTQGAGSDKLGPGIRSSYSLEQASYLPCCYLSRLGLP